jgi:hypothetical protein
MKTDVYCTPTRGGITLVQEDRTAKVTVDLPKDQVRILIINMCRNAGLPDPWKG